MCSLNLSRQGHIDCGTIRIIGRVGVRWQDTLAEKERLQAIFAPICRPLIITLYLGKYLKSYHSPQVQLKSLSPMMLQAVQCYLTT